ncbi:MAG TPA: acyltransferase [Candidatus Acidoferrales bacterium]|nr:acyltransferase [Candidatus Acidoferrales bacterium]
MLPGTRKSRLTERASVHLDMARGVAALAVLVGHVRGLFFVDYHDLPHHSPLVSAFYAATALGHQAVVVFFVLSGFFIVSSIADSFEQHRWSWTAYLVNRVTRLSLVLIPSLILCWILDRIGMAMAATAPLYQHPVANLFTDSIANLETFRNFVGNLFYLQGILVQPFGSNAPLWSLSYEFWYYIIFPLAICALVKRYRPTMRIVYLVLAILVTWFVGYVIASYFLIWLLGGAIAISRAVKWSPVRCSGAMAATAIPFVLALGLSVAHPLNSPFLMDAIVALAFSSWIYTVVEAPEKSMSALYAKPARLFAGFSYTLYLTHFPFVFLLRSRIIGSRSWNPTFVHFVYALLITAGATLVAYLLALGTETKTAAARRKVMSLFPSACHAAHAKS